MFSALATATTGSTPAGRSCPTSAPGCSGSPRTGWCSSYRRLRHRDRHHHRPAVPADAACFAVRRPDRRPLRQAGVLKITQAWLALCARHLGCWPSPGSSLLARLRARAALRLGTAFDNPARQAFVTEVVGAEHLPNAVGLNSATFHAARIVGPAVAGLVIAASAPAGRSCQRRSPTPPSSLAICCWTRTASAPVRAGRPGQAPDPSKACYVRRRPDLVLVLSVVFCVGTFGMNFQMTQRADGAAGIRLALQRTASSARSSPSAPCPVRCSRPGDGLRRARLRGDHGVLFALVEIVAGLMPTYAWYAAVLPVLGLTTLLTLTAANASIQLGVEPRLRGSGDGALSHAAAGWHAARCPDSGLGGGGLRAPLDTDRRGFPGCGRGAG